MHLIKSHYLFFVLIAFVLNAAAQEKNYYIYNSSKMAHTEIPFLLFDLRYSKDVDLESRLLTLRFSANEEQRKKPTIGWRLEDNQNKRGFFFRQFYPLRRFFPDKSFTTLSVKKVYPYLRPKILRYNLPKMEQGRGNYPKSNSINSKSIKSKSNNMSQDLFLHAKHDLRSATLLSNHVIYIDNMPIVINGKYEGSIEYRTGKNNWIKSNFNIISSYVTPTHPKSRVLKDSRDSTYTIDLDLLVSSPSLLRENWMVKFQLPQNDGIVWDEDRIQSSEFLVKNYRQPVRFEFLNKSEILLHVTSGFTPNTIYTFLDLPVRTEDLSDGVGIEVSISADGEKYVSFGQTKNNIKVVAPTAEYIHSNSKSFVTIFKNNNHLVLPDLIIKSGPIQWLDETSKVSLILQDSTLGWMDYLELDDMKAFPYRVDTTSIITFDPPAIKVPPYPSRDRSVAYMASMRFKKIVESRSGIRFKVIIETQNDTQIVADPAPITIGQPTASIMENNVIIASSNGPVLRELVVQEDSKVSTLGVGDTIRYSILAPGVEFNSSLLNTISQPKGKLKILSNSNNPTHLEMVVLNDLSAGEVLHIKNIPLVIKKKQSITTKGKIEFATVHGTKYSAIDNYTIEIITVALNLERSEEYFPLSSKNSSNYTLPPLRLTNEGSVKILMGKQVIIEIEKDSSSTFDLEFLRIGPHSDISRENIYSRGNSLILDFPNGMSPKRTLELDGLGISSPPSSPFYYQSQLSANFGVETNNIVSSNTVTYGSPAFISPYEQKFISGGENALLYSINCDFDRMPKTLNELKSLQFKIPDSVPLEWDNGMEVQVANAAGILHPLNISFPNPKVLVIDLDRGARTELKVGKKFEIFGLAFKAPLPEEVSTFTLEVSLDGGETFGVQIAPKKHIISSTDRSFIDRQRVQEDYYPFEKGRKIELVIDDDSEMKWDNGYKVLGYTQYDKDMSRDKIFYSKIRFSTDAKTARIEVAYDINSPPKGNKIYRLMDFGENVTVTGLALTNWQQYSRASLAVRLNTLYGPREIDGKSGQYEMDIYNEDESVSIKLGLLSYPDREQLSQDFLINWYRYRERYLPQLHLKGRDEVEYNSEDIGNDLLRLKEELNKYYHFVGSDAYYDWAYWYYAAWYKKRIRDIRGSTFNNFDLDDPISNSSFVSDDISRAITYGYDIEIYGSDFPSPLDTSEVRQLRQIAYNNADKLFDKREYLKAEDIIYENFDLPGMDNYLKAAYYAMLGRIALAVNDKSEFPNRRLKINESYECRMYNLARNALNGRKARQKLNEWKPDLYTFIVNAECSNKSDDETLLTGEIRFAGVADHQVTNPNPMNLTISWKPEKIAKRYKMQYSLNSYPVIERANIRTLRYDKIKKELLPFNQNVDLYGGNTYTINYDVKRNSILKTGTALTTTGLLLLWGNF